MKLTMLDEHRSGHFTHYDSTLQPQILQQFNACRHSNRFVDLEVQVESVIFPCHQILMDAFCPYFAAYFSFHERKSVDGHDDDTGRRMERVVLKYNGVTVNGFSKLLDFMYTAELEVKDMLLDIDKCIYVTEGYFKVLILYV